MVGRRGYNQRNSGTRYYRGGGGGGGNGYSHGGYQQDQSQHNTWGSSAAPVDNQQLSAMALELEVMKRKRQMLQEQRQLLEEQRQFEMLQKQYSSYNDDGGYADMYQQESEQRRAPKRPAPAMHAQASKKPAPFKHPAPAKKSAAPKQQPGPEKHTAKNDIISQVERDVGPVDLPVANVFRSVDSITPIIRGRLEYALGHICRGMREMYSSEPYNYTLSMPQMKFLKERVRNRLHAVMMNKAVDNSDKIIQQYRNVHPVDEDISILDEVIKASLVFADPTLKVEVKDEVNSKKEDFNLIAEFRSRKQRKRIYEPKGELSKMVRLNLHCLLEEKMDVVFAELVKLFKEKGTELFKKAAKTEKPNAESEEGAASKADGAPAEQNESIEPPAPDSEVKVKDEASETADSEASSVSKERNIQANTEKALVEFVENRMDAQEAFEKLRPMISWFLDHKLPAVLPRYKDHLIHLLSHDDQMQELGLKALGDIENIPRTKIYSKLHFVKVLGRPSLPNRDQTTRFLKTFNVISVKKHRNAYNLLFVGLPTEELANKLIANDGIRIGGKKLSIKISERTRPEDGEAEASADPSFDESSNGVSQAGGGDSAAEASDTATDKAALEEVNTEINNLMTSITETNKQPVSVSDVTEVTVSDVTEVAVSDVTEVAAEEVETVVVEDDTPDESPNAQQPQESEATGTEAGGVKTRRSSRRTQN